VQDASAEQTAPADQADREQTHEKQEAWPSDCVPEPTCSLTAEAVDVIVARTRLENG
jgi:hypothetical protein